MSASSSEPPVSILATAVVPWTDRFEFDEPVFRRQVHTIVEETDAVLRGTGDERMSVTGYESSKWVVQDYGDVVVHVFDTDTRGYYNLEELWGDAEVVDWEDEME